MENTRFKDITATKYFDADKPQRGTGKFTDKHFPPNYTSLVGLDKDKQEYKSDSDLPESLKKYKSLTWKRISDFIEFPMLFNGEITVNDVKQGGLGNCYWLAALSSLASEPRWIYNLFITKSYKEEGLYEMQLFINGEWQIVVVDDYIPIRDLTQKPAFTHAKDGEIWMILLEKAWAKVNGSYKKTVGGFGRESFLALTSYSVKHVKHSYKAPDLMFDSLKAAMRKGFFAQAGSKVMKLKKSGIFGDHAYSVIDAFEIENKKGQKERVIQLRNPHGKSEWTGTWTREGFVPDDKGISEVDLREKGLGLFYIPYSEFVLYFKYAFICYIEYSSKVKSFQLERGQVEQGQCFHLRLEERANLNIEVYYKKKKFTKTVEPLFPVIGVAKVGNGNCIDLLLNARKDKLCWENFNLEKGEYLVWIHPNYYKTLTRYNGISVKFASKGSFYAEKTCKDADLKVIRSLICQSVLRENSQIDCYCDESYLGSQIGVYLRTNNTKNSLSLQKTESKGFLDVIYSAEGDKVMLSPGEKVSAISLFDQSAFGHIFTPFSDKLEVSAENKAKVIEDVLTIPKEAFSSNLKECSDEWYDFILRSEEEMQFANKFHSNKEITVVFNALKELDYQAWTELFSIKSEQTGNKYAIIDGNTGTYYGQVDEQSLFTGIGVLIERIGCFKVGNWVKGQLNGEGKEFKKGQLTYSGEFKEGKYNGDGIFYRKGSTSYIGALNRGFANGKGKLFLRNKATWEGEFKGGCPIGVGKYCAESGKVSYFDLNTG